MVENFKISIFVDTFYTTNAILLSLRFSVKEGNAVHNRIGKTLALRLLVKEILKKPFNAFKLFSTKLIYLTFLKH